MSAASPGRPPHPWERDVELGAEGARHLIEQQFRELAPARLERFGDGFDNDAWLVNGEWVFRFPRRAFAAPFLENEARWLPGLAPALTLPVPRHEYLGRADGGYPYPFAGYRLLPGRSADSVRPTPARRASAAEPLGRFLAALHACAIDAEAHACGPRDAIGRSDPQLRLRRLLEALERVEARGEPLDAAPIRARAAAAADSPRPSDELRWVHGDLYARHLLVDEGCEVSGVIDWGDLHLGDRALDLSIAFTFVPPDARPEFFGAYGGIDAATAERARLRALFYGAVLLDVGLQRGDAALAELGRLGLAQGVV